MRPYLRPPWTNSCQIWCVRAFHHVLLKYGHENAEMQKKKLDDVKLQYCILKELNLHHKVIFTLPSNIVCFRLTTSLARRNRIWVWTLEPSDSLSSSSTLFYSPIGLPVFGLLDLMSRGKSVVCGVPHCSIFEPLLCLFHLSIGIPAFIFTRMNEFTLIAWEIIGLTKIIICGVLSLNWLNTRSIFCFNKQRCLLKLVVDKTCQFKGALDKCNIYRFTSNSMKDCKSN